MILMQKYYRPFLKVTSAFFVNLSVVLFTVVFIGPNISFPQDVKDFVVLTSYILFGIVCLVLALWCEKEIEQYE